MLTYTFLYRFHPQNESKQENRYPILIRSFNTSLPHIIYLFQSSEILQKKTHFPLYYSLINLLIYNMTRYIYRIFYEGHLNSTKQIKLIDKGWLGICEVL